MPAGASKQPWHRTTSIPAAVARSNTRTSCRTSYAWPSSDEERCLIAYKWPELLWRARYTALPTEQYTRSRRSKSRGDQEPNISTASFRTAFKLDSEGFHEMNSMRGNRTRVYGNSEENGKCKKSLNSSMVRLHGMVHWHGLHAPDRRLVTAVPVRRSGPVAARSRPSAKRPRICGSAAVQKKKTAGFFYMIMRDILFIGVRKSVSSIEYLHVFNASALRGFFGPCLSSCD